MGRSTLLWIIVVVALLGGAWYIYEINFGTGGAYSNQVITVQNQPSTVSNITPTTTATTTENIYTTTTLLSATSSATLNSYLVASNGMTLYIYTEDSPGASNCYGQCAVTWPPYTATSGTVLIAGTGVNGKLSTIARSDGSLQLTYNGQPLYFYDKDVNPGDTNGQGVGNVWYVISP